MSKRYMVFVDEAQLAVLIVQVKQVLDKAIATQRAELIIPLAGLVHQLKNPRELRDKQRGIFPLVKEKVLGK